MTAVVVPSSDPHPGLIRRRHDAHAMSQEPQPARNQPRRHATPDEPHARDERYTVAQQLSRIVFYEGPQAADILRRIDWATDAQKVYAVATHQAMTGNDRTGWAAL